MAGDVDEGTEPVQRPIQILLGEADPLFGQQVLGTVQIDTRRLLRIAHPGQVVVQRGAEQQTAGIEHDRQGQPGPEGFQQLRRQHDHHRHGTGRWMHAAQQQHAQHHCPQGHGQANSQFGSGQRRQVKHSSTGQTGKQITAQDRPGLGQRAGGHHEQQHRRCAGRPQQHHGGGGAIEQTGQPVGEHHCQRHTAGGTQPLTGSGLHGTGQPAEEAAGEKQQLIRHRHLFLPVTADSASETGTAKGYQRGRLYCLSGRQQAKR